MSAKSLKDEFLKIRVKIFKLVLKINFINLKYVSNYSKLDI